MIEMCRFYSTSGYPDFKPKCLAGDSFHVYTRRPGLKCHKRRLECLLYQPSEERNEETKLG